MIIINSESDNDSAEGCNNGDADSVDGDEDVTNTMMMMSSM